MSEEPHPEDVAGGCLGAMAISLGVWLLVLSTCVHAVHP